jgi:hypothetical protein
MFLLKVIQPLINDDFIKAKKKSRVLEFEYYITKKRRARTQN